VGEFLDAAEDSLAGVGVEGDGLWLPLFDFPLKTKTHHRGAEDTEKRRSGVQNLSAGFSLIAFSANSAALW